MGEPKRRAQVFVELRAEDPEAASALAIARERLPAGRALAGVRRFRVFELEGALPEPGALAGRLHGSTQFYNPAKERATLRTAAGDPQPVDPEEVLVLVVDRGGERRPAAERWWRHESGERVAVREGTVWALRFEPGPGAAALAEDLAVTRGRAHGLFANPHFQAHHVCAGGAPPLDWMSTRPAAARTRTRRTA
jgi:hypothetical protein